MKKKLSDIEYISKIEELENKIFFLETRNRHHELFSRNLKDILWEMDLEFNMKYISDSIEKYTDYTADEWIDLPLYERHPKEEMINFLKLSKILLKKAKDGEIDKREFCHTTESIYYKKDGTTLKMEVLTSASIDEKGNVIGILGVSRDITKRKEDEQLIKDSKEKYKNLFNTMEDGVFLYNNNYMIANDSYLKMFNAKSSEELMEYKVEGVSPKYQPDGKLSVDKIKENMEIIEKQGKYSFEWTHKKIGGEEF